MNEEAPALGDGKGGAGGVSVESTQDRPLSFDAQAKLVDVPLALLTFTPELTAFDGGGVSELERKAREHGMRVTYLAPPPNNPDPDTQLVALTLIDGGIDS